jgi:hypothetical protein
MGIQALLHNLKDAYEDVHISEFKGKKAVIDALSWLHKAYGGFLFPSL